MTIFETERLRVRQYTPDDEFNFFLMNGDEEIVRYIRPAKSFEECKIFLSGVIQYSMDNPLYGRWAAEEKDTGTFVGSFAIIPVGNTPDMQLGYALLKKEWGKGYATELTLRGINYAFNVAGLDVIYGITETENLDSQKVLLKCGFRPFETYREAGKLLQKFRLDKK